MRLIPFAASALALLAALAFAVYLPYLANPLVFDDTGLFNGNTIYDYAAEFWRPQLRWLPYATFAHVHMLTDGSIAGNRVGNLLLHVANAFAIYVLLNLLLAATGSAGNSKETLTHSTIALLGAALFAVHPVVVYGVGYLIQRSILMSTLFMLIMLITWTRGLTQARNAMFWWSVLWYALSVFSKEHSIAAPVVAILLAVTIRKPSRELARSIALPLVVMAFIATVVAAMVKGVIGSAYEIHGPEMLADLRVLAGTSDAVRIYPLSVATQMLLYFKYMFLWFFPDITRMSIDMREAIATSVFEWPYWGAALAFLCYPIVALTQVVKGGRQGLVGWLLIYPWLMFVTELSTVRLQEPFVLYRAYLWFPLIAALIPMAISRINLRLSIGVVTAMLFILLPLSWNRLASLSDPLLTWNDAAKLVRSDHDMGALRIYYNRALALSEQGKKHEALHDLDKVISQKPNMAPIRLARARIRFELKEYLLAMDDLNASIGSDPRRADAYYARAITFRRLGRETEAWSDFKKSCELGYSIGCFAAKRQ